MTEGMSQNTPPPDLEGTQSNDRPADIDRSDDIDHAEAVTELKLREVAYRGALGTTDNVLQPTLKDFLR